MADAVVGPVERPARWTEYVNRPQSAAEEAAIGEAIRRGRPYGDADWQHAVATRLGIESSLRPRGRPECGKSKTPDPFDVSGRCRGIRSVTWTG